MAKKNQLGTPAAELSAAKGISPERKIEILGVALLLFGLLSVLAILSNYENDYQVLTQLGFFDLFKSEHTSQIHNWLGIFGAVLSHHLIYNYLGYPVLIQSLMLFVWGWVMLRHHGLSKPTYFTVYALVFNLLLSSLFGFVAILSDSGLTDNAWSGMIGIFLASMTHSILGGIGGMIVLLAALFVTLVLFVDLDLKATAQRLQTFVETLSGNAAEKWKNRGVKQSEPEIEEENQEDEIPAGNHQPVEPPVVAKPEPEPVKIYNQPIIPATESYPPEKPAEPETQTVKSQNKPVGIPINEIISREEREERRAVAAAHAEPVVPPKLKEVVVDLSEFRGTEDDFVPVSQPVAKPETRVPDQVEATSLPIETSPDISKVEETPELPASGEKQPAKPTFFGQLLKKIEETKPAESARSESDLKTEPQTQPVKISESSLADDQFDQDEIDIPDLLEITEEDQIPLPAEKQQEVETIVQAKEPEFQGVTIGNEFPEIHEQAIELKINPIVEEKKANLPKDPIFRFGYRKPSLDLLQQNHQTVADIIDPVELEQNAAKLVHKLGTYGIQVDGKPEVTVGPRVTLFEIKPAEGIKVSRITSLSDDIALAMAARGIRIMAPVPGKSVVGVEIPNKKSVNVLLREILESDKFQKAAENGYILPVAFGRTINNGIYIEDLAKLPHLLIAGTTGSGKSVGINTIICSLIYHSHPSNLKFVMIDPKKIELSIYKRLEKHFLAVLPELDEPILTDTSKAVTLLRAVEREMDERYSLLARVSVRHLKDFNRKVEAGELLGPDDDPYVKLPYIVVIIDELADLMMTSGKEVEEPIARIAQLARAVGIHLVVATQRPSVDVITGIIKANFPARIAYMVTSKIDSRTILDMNGADQLLGNGDMLYLPSGSPKPERIQNAFVSTEECEAIISHVAKQPGFISAYRLPYPPDKTAAGKTKKAIGNTDAGGMEDWDDMLAEAGQVVVLAQQGSTSLLQRKLKVGYSRAARIIDQLEILGIVGPPDGSKARQVTIDDMDTLNDILNTM
ncbi:MAG: DNA translocase FtsK 4TM domain-containing protein [Bacteroidetes bacterium]|nr:DNA translocase FtsK 4TM domain-containing protein [Bacteroidota bacterium]